MVFLTIALALVGCGNKKSGKANPTPSPTPLILPTVRSSVLPPVQLTVQPTIQPTPTLLVLGPLFDPALDIKAEPVEVPLKLQIPSLKVDAPVFGVGLNPDNVMDTPRGPIGDAVWHTAFWYRGSGLPGESGTATFAGHVNDPLGRFEIFADLEDLQSGDLIIIHYITQNIDIRFKVDEVRTYSLQESSAPAVLSRIYGTGPVAGTGPQPALDGLSHLTLITCAGNIVGGQFDHHTVVFATRSN